jgi:hypothetical protein
VIGARGAHTCSLWVGCCKQGLGATVCTLCMVPTWAVERESYKKMSKLACHSALFTPLVDRASNAASLRYHTGDLSCNPPANSQMVTGCSGSCSHSHHYTSRARAAGLFYVDILASQILTPRCLARSALLSNCGHHSHGPYACSVTDAQPDKALQCLLLKCQAKVLPHTW